MRWRSSSPPSSSPWASSTTTSRRSRTPTSSPSSAVDDRVGSRAMRTLVTGATGKVGHATARILLAEGHEVRALVRDPARAAGVVPEGVELVAGDVTDPPSVARAAEGCEVVFNAMGLPEQWLADADLFERGNVGGARAVLGAARGWGARRGVSASTIAVFHG